jgi:hypothetical protein
MLCNTYNCVCLYNYNTKLYKKFQNFLNPTTHYIPNRQNVQNVWYYNTSLQASFLENLYIPKQRLYYIYAYYIWHVIFYDVSASIAAIVYLTRCQPVKRLRQSSVIPNAEGAISNKMTRTTVWSWSEEFTWVFGIFYVQTNKVIHEQQCTFVRRSMWIMY